MLSLIFFLFYRNTVRINVQASTFNIESFGFEKGGKSATRFLSYSNSQTLYFVILNSEEQKIYSKQRQSLNNASALCSMKENYTHFQKIIDIPNSYEFIVDEPTVYYYKIVECGPSNKIEARLVNTFVNPSTHLDIRWVGIIKAKIITILISIVVLSYWFINWFFHFRVQIWIHYLFTLTFIFVVLTEFVRLLEFKALDQEDVSVFWTPLRISFEVIGSIIGFLTLLLASKGWCIIRDEISVKELILAVVYSVISLIFVAIPQYFYLGSFELPAFLLSLLFVGLYVRELIVSINDASLHILAHMLAISNEGIDPQTTPVYRKHLMYQYFEYAVIGACTLVLVEICIQMFVEVPYWIFETMTDFVIIIVIIVLEIIFRLRVSTNGTYETIHGSGDREMQLADIETASRGGFREKGGRKWEEGMPLPEMPNIIKNKQERRQEEDLPTVIISSPDGTESLNAIVEPNEHDDTK